MKTSPRGNLHCGVLDRFIVSRESIAGFNEAEGYYRVQYGGIRCAEVRARPGK
jgi:hypothetical protein